MWTILICINITYLRSDLDSVIWRKKLLTTFGSQNAFPLLASCPLLQVWAIGVVQNIDY